MNWLILVGSSLACFRLTRLITDDKITDWFRAWVVHEAPRKLKTKAKQGIKCPFCVSYYYSVGITAGLWYIGLCPLNESWLWQPAIWGGSVLFNQTFMWLTENV